MEFTNKDFNRLLGHIDEHNSTNGKLEQLISGGSSAGRNKYQEKKKLKVCTKCGKVTGNDTSFCRQCYFNDLAYKHTGDKNNGPKLLEMLEKQENKCAFTDKKLVYGKNLSVDHKIPTSRGGKKSLDNVHFVDKDLNRTKNDLTCEEFINLCHYISNKFKDKGNKNEAK